MKNTSVNKSNSDTNIEQEVYNIFYEFSNYEAL